MAKRSIKKPPSMLSLELAKAMAHSTRVYAMGILSARQASPREIAEELDEATKNVAYHFGVLEDLDCIELVATKPARGGRVVEHFYRATRRPYFDATAWEALDDDKKWGVVMPILRLMSKELNESLSIGTFMDPDDNHVSRTPMVVDQEGYEKSKAILEQAVSELIAEQEAMFDRCEDGRDTMLIKVNIIQFRSPDERDA